MAFKDLDKKVQIVIIVAITVVIVVIGCIFAHSMSSPAPTKAIVKNNDTNSADSTGNCLLEIDATGDWVVYQTVNGEYTSYKGSGDRTVDLGSVDSASITIDLQGAGELEAELKSNGKTLKEASTNVDWGAVVLIYNMQISLPLQGEIIFYFFICCLFFFSVYLISVLGGFSVDQCL